MVHRPVTHNAIEPASYIRTGAQLVSSTVGHDEGVLHEVFDMITMASQTFDDAQQELDMLLEQLADVDWNRRVLPGHRRSMGHSTSFPAVAPFFAWISAHSTDSDHNASVKERSYLCGLSSCGAEKTADHNKRTTRKR